MTVVDLGAAPGGWSQVAATAVAPRGRVIAVDLLEMDALSGVTRVRGDFGDEAVLSSLERHLQGSQVDIVLSDMAPNISGVASADQARAMALSMPSLATASVPESSTRTGRVAVPIAAMTRERVWTP